MEVLLGIPGRRRCDGAVVVRTQCRGLLLDGRLPRHHVLLRPQASGTPRVLLPFVGRALLGTDLGLYVGRPSPSDLHDAPRLGTVTRHDLLAHPDCAVVGRNDQRHHDALRRMA